MTKPGKTFVALLFVIYFFAILSACNNQGKKTYQGAQPKINVAELLKSSNIDTSSQFSAPFYYTLLPAKVRCRIPALQSFVFGEYNDLWVFIGGEKAGFHGTAEDPPPFQANVSNDSIWVIDIANQQSWSAPVPGAWQSTLGATNSAYCQVNNLLYLCGGFTVNNATAKHFNYTSNSLLEIDLNALVSYVQNNNSKSSLNAIITKQIQSPFVQVTGGALIYNNGFFYLVGGQNYNTVYSAGITGNYTNAIRRFNIKQQLGLWVVSDTSSLVDPVNLHRRDMNVVPGPAGYNGSAILYGGVFTKNDEAYLNAVFINGLSSGTPTITVDSMQQKLNQYACAVATYTDASVAVAVTSFFGGISHLMFDKQTQSLVVGDQGIPMPFSNMASTIATGGGINNSTEYIQIPPAAPLLPGYIGANALFIPDPSVALSANPMMIDVKKINADTSAQAMVGYLFGGIVSGGPTSGTTANGYVPTYANPVLYKVYLNFPR